MIDDLKPTFEHYYPEGVIGGECGTFARKLVDIRPVGNTIATKRAAVTKYGILVKDLHGDFQTGDVVIFEYEDTGHVAVVNNRPLGMVRLTESNYHLNKRVTHNRIITPSLKSIVGVIRGPLKVAVINPPVDFIRLRVQLVFNNQKYAQELGIASNANLRMRYLSNDKVILEFLPPIYTKFKDIPTVDYVQPISGETDTAIERRWFLQYPYDLAPKTADVVVFVGPQGDWRNQGNGFTTYGHYYTTDPTTFPLLIQMVAGEKDKSWKWQELNAFVHYLTHEISHGLIQATGVTDTTHKFDYATQDGLQQVLPGLNYSLIAGIMNQPVDYMPEFLVYRTTADTTLYVDIGGKNLIPIAANWKVFIQDFPKAKVKILSPNEMLTYNQGSKVLIKER